MQHQLLPQEITASNSNKGTDPAKQKGFKSHSIRETGSSQTQSSSFVPSLPFLFFIKIQKTHAMNESPCNDTSYLYFVTFFSDYHIWRSHRF